MRNSPIPHPKGSRFLMLREEYLKIADGDHCGAAILGWLQVAVPGCFNRQDALAGILGLYGEKAVNSALAYLSGEGLLCRHAPDPHSIQSALSSKAGQSLRFGKETCSWCGGTTFALEDHHFPVSRADGGTETVRVCANCHREYHWMMERATYGMTERLASVFAEHPLPGSVTAELEAR